MYYLAMTASAVKNGETVQRPSPYVGSIGVHTRVLLASAGAAVCHSNKHIEGISDTFSRGILRKLANKSHSTGVLIWCAGNQSELRRVLGMRIARNISSSVRQVAVVRKLACSTGLRAVVLSIQWDRKPAQSQCGWMSSKLHTDRY